MKSHIVFTVGIIFSILIQIHADQAVKKCGGNDTEITLQILSNVDDSNYHCTGHQIHSHGVIVPAFFVDRVSPEMLRVIRRRNILTESSRNVSDIFIHPLYSRCSPQYDLAVLILTEAFDVDYDVICIEDPNLIDSYQHRESSLITNYRYAHRTQYSSTAVINKKCSLTDNFFQADRLYHSAFTTYTYRPDENSETIKSLYAFHFERVHDDLKTVQETSKLYDANWFNMMIRCVIPTYINLYNNGKENLKIPKIKSLQGTNFKVKVSLKAGETITLTECKVGI